MTAPFTVQALVWEGSDCLILSRVRSIFGTLQNPPVYLQQSDLTSIQLTVYDKNSGLTVTYTTALNVSSTVFNTLQQNPVAWPVDAIGYNFLARIPGASAFSNNSDYRVDAIGTLTDGTSLVIFQGDLTTQPVP